MGLDLEAFPTMDTLSQFHPLKIKMAGTDLFLPLVIGHGEPGFRPDKKKN